MGPFCNLTTHSMFSGVNAIRAACWIMAISSHSNRFGLYRNTKGFQGIGFVHIRTVNRFPPNPGTR